MFEKDSRRPRQKSSTFVDLLFQKKRNHSRLFRDLISEGLQLSQRPRDKSPEYEVSFTRHAFLPENECLEVNEKREEIMLPKRSSCLVN